MDIANYTPKEISVYVRMALKKKGLTLRKCCEEFNKANEKRILAKEMRSMDKDFVSRVCSKRFKVSSDRVAQLCEFLGLEESVQKAQLTFALQKEYERVEKLLRDNPRLLPRIKNLLNDITDLASSARENDHG